MLEVYMNLLTEEGAKLHAKTVAGEKMEITRFAIGNGIYTGTESQASIMKMTALKAQKNSYGVTKVEQVNGATCRVTMAATNKIIAKGPVTPARIDQGRIAFFFAFLKAFFWAFISSFFSFSMIFLLILPKSINFII